MKNKIFTAIICLVLVVASVFTTLQVSNVYNFRKELVDVIERDCVNKFSDSQPIEIKKVVDIIDLNDTVITVCTVLEKYENQDKILVAFFDKTNPYFSLEDIWVLTDYKNTNGYFNVQHQYISDDSIFISFSRSNKIKVRKENYTYKDYKIYAYNKEENYTLRYRVSNKIEYPICMKYYDHGFGSYNRTNVVSFFIDKDNVLYIATKKKNQYDDYDHEAKIENSKDFEEVYKNMKISKIKLENYMAEDIYNQILLISKYLLWFTESDGMSIKMGDCEFFTSVQDYYDETDSYDYSNENKLFYAQCELFELLDKYFTDEDINIKFGER